jgi:tetratricopeptide (TPR) repeat protein
MYYLEGRYQEGWAAIQSVLQSQQGGAMSRAVLLLDRLGRTNDAEKLARFALNRYPGSLPNRCDLLEILWRQGKYVEAATIIKASPSPPNAWEWRSVIGKRFTEVFQGQSSEKPLQAFSAFLSAGSGSWFLLELVKQVNEGGNPDLAFQMASQLRSAGMEDMHLRVEAYHFLKLAQGQSKALQWIGNVVPTPGRNPLSMFAFTNNEFELLWDLPNLPESQDHPEFVWLMRAAASAKIGSDKDPHHDDLVRYYKNASQGPYDVIGRYLIGLATEEQILALAIDPKKRCEIAYYIGLRAQGEGRTEDASDWYRVSIETGLTNNGEYRWAYTTLNQWNTQGKPLSQITVGH